VAGGGERVWHMSQFHRCDFFVDLRDKFRLPYACAQGDCGGVFFFFRRDSHGFLIKGIVLLCHIKFPGHNMYIKKENAIVGNKSDASNGKQLRAVLRNIPG
jgi:hypothetical protein